MTVLKQEIPSPFGSNDQVKKINKPSALNKEQVDEISQIDQVTIKNGNAGNNTTANTNVAGCGAISVATTVAACHLNGNNSNSNSSTSNELVNCLENVAAAAAAAAAAQHQSNANDQNDERNETNGLSMKFLGILNIFFCFY